MLLDATTTANSFHYYYGSPVQGTSSSLSEIADEQENINPEENPNCLRLHDAIRDGESLKMNLTRGATRTLVINEIDTKTISRLNIKNLKSPHPDCFSSGEPTKRQLEGIALAGIKHIISLLPPEKQKEYQEQDVLDLKMSYKNIIVDGETGVTFSNAELLLKTIASFNDEPYLLHCASGNRNGALIALYSGKKDGKSVSESIEVGKKWGLSRYEELVRGMLQQKS